jgi:hypothetical protein
MQQRGFTRCHPRRLNIFRNILRDNLWDNLKIALRAASIASIELGGDLRALAGFSRGLGGACWPASGLARGGRKAGRPVAWGPQEVGLPDFDGTKPISHKWFWIVRVAGHAQRRWRVSAAGDRVWQAKSASPSLAGQEGVGGGLPPLGFDAKHAAALGGIGGAVIFVGSGGEVSGFVEHDGAGAGCGSVMGDAWSGGFL